MMGKLFGEGGRVKTVREIILGGICPSVGGFSGPFSGGIDRYDWSGHDVQLDGGMNIWSNRE